MNMIDKISIAVVIFCLGFLVGVIGIQETDLARVEDELRECQEQYMPIDAVMSAWNMGYAEGKLEMFKAYADTTHPRHANTLYFLELDADQAHDTWQRYMRRE